MENEWKLLISTKKCLILTSNGTDDIYVIVLLSWMQQSRVSSDDIKLIRFITFKVLFMTFGGTTQKIC